MGFCVATSTPTPKARACFINETSGARPDLDAQMNGHERERKTASAPIRRARSAAEHRSLVESRATLAYRRVWRSQSRTPFLARSAHPRLYPDAGFESPHAR